LSLFFLGFLAAGGSMTACVLKLLTKPAEVPADVATVVAGCMKEDRLNLLAKRALLLAALPGVMVSGGLLTSAAALGLLLLLL
jgi:hypothetical protein